jgi:hypothetical protein
MADMITALVPLGAVTFTPEQVALILAAMLLGAIIACLPVSLPLGLYGAAEARRAGRPSTTAGLTWWFGGTLLTLASIWAVSATGLDGLPVVVLGWLPGAAVLGYLHRRRARLGT